MRKLIIFLLFLVFTVAAIGFISFSTFTMATNFVMVPNLEATEEAVTYGAAVLTADNLVVINNPLAEFLPDFSQIIVAQIPASETTEAIGYVFIVGADLTLTESAVIDANGVYVTGAFVFMWLFFLILIILLPRKRSKKSVRKVAEAVVDDEMDSRPAPKRSYNEGRRRRDYDEDYDE